MNCDEARQLLHAYMDDELDLATAMQIEKHLPDCPKCREEMEAARHRRPRQGRRAPAGVDPAR